MQAICLCGQPMDKRDRCPICGVRWERDKFGFWAEGFRAVVFTPSKLRLNHYQKYMKWRDRASKTAKSQAGSRKSG